MLNMCYTGHRPELLGGYDWNTEVNQKILLRLHEHAIAFISNNLQYKNFRVYFGGALGIDQMAFVVWKQIRDEYAIWDLNVKLFLAIPFKQYDSKWLSQIDKDRFKYQIEDADEVIYVDTEVGYECKHVSVGEYHSSKNHIRNNYMVDHSDVIIAVWNGQKDGGTASCVRYAKRKNKEVIVLHPEEIGMCKTNQQPESE